MPHPAPAASVVVPTHRGADRLPALLGALAAQQVDQPVEVVVVLDGPDAATEDVLAAAPEDLPLVVVRRPAPGGVAAAMNAGIAAAHGRVVIRCDDDLTPAPDMVARHLAHHVGRDPVGVIGPTLDELPDSPYARAFGRAASARSVAAVVAATADERWRHWAAHCSVRRDVLLAVGGYDESFRYREDSELGLRLHRHGVRIVVDEHLVLPHRGAATDAGTRLGRAWVSGAAQVRFAQRHPDVPVDPAVPSGSADGAKDAAWRVLTALVGSGVRTRANAERLGRLLDTALPHVPPSVGRRLVALGAQAAADSGRRHGRGDQSGYGTRG